MTRALCFVLLSFVVACSAPPPKPRTPALTPEIAASLLHYNSRAETWLLHVRKNDASCGYRLDLPDQSSNPTEIDLSHIVVCGNRPAPKEFDASVSFAYDKNQQRWVVTRFAS